VSALRRSLKAEEADLHRPVERVGLLVVQHDCLIGWMIGRGVNSVADSRARRRTLAILNQLVRDGSDKLRKLRGRGYIEAAKKKRSMLRQLVLDPLTVVPGPVGKIEIFCGGFAHQRELSLW